MAFISDSAGFFLKLIPISIPCIKFIFARHLFGLLLLRRPHRLQD